MQRLKLALLSLNKLIPLTNEKKNEFRYKLSVEVRKVFYLRCFMNTTISKFNAHKVAIW